MQSSSAVTVMAVGLTGAGLLGLEQAAALVIGANVGATVTGQLLAFRPGALVYPALLLGLLLDRLGRAGKCRAAGRALFSLGLLFHGMELMGGALAPLAASPRAMALLAGASRSPALGAAAGAAMTALVQSSSATLAALQRLASQAGPDGVHSVLGLAGAVPILLGSNIGTTATALLAAAGRGRDAARAALAHLLFNVSGALVCLALLPAFLRLVTALSPAGPEADVIARQIANAHTLFNLLAAALWLPFTDKLAALAARLVPTRRRPRPELYQ